jgi:alkanesulfonate monooxygenase SsuD/methylene tetrahydromethanopterin reductase-like flavin-dependent oxidoreductase (luciferase family)
VIFQAGASPRGRDQAAKFADAVFTAQHLIEGALEFRGDIRDRAAAYGRDPDSIKVLPGVSIILGATETEARQRKQHLEDVLGPGPHLEKLARRVGLPVDALQDLDQPFPAHLLGPDEEFKGSIGFRRSIVSLAVKENLTVRELVANYGGGHQQIVGTPERLLNRHCGSPWRPPPNGAPTRRSLPPVTCTSRCTTRVTGRSTPRRGGSWTPSAALTGSSSRRPATTAARRAC